MSIEVRRETGAEFVEEKGAQGGGFGVCWVNGEVAVTMAGR